MNEPATHIYNLPGDLFPQSDAASKPIIFHDYAARTGTFNGKSVLQKNAISLVISGEKTMHFAEHTVVVHDTEFHLLSAGNCLASVDLSKQEVFKSLLVFFDDRVLTDFYVRYQQLINRVKPKKKLKPQPYISLPKDPFIVNYIRSVQLLISTHRQLPDEMQLLKFEELMLYLVQKHPETILSFQTSHERQPQTLTIRKVVETNITNPVTVEEMAFLCNMSLSTFKRHFLRIYGSSPNKWVLQRRMEMACKLLQQGEKPAGVFHRVGYQNHSSFSESFRKTYGVSPKTYQQKKLDVLP